MVFPTDVMISQTLSKNRIITVAAAFAIAHQISNAGFRMPEIVTYTPDGNLTVGEAIARGHVNLTDKYPFHFIWLDPDGEPIDWTGVECSAFAPVKGRPTEFLSKLLTSPIGQKTMGTNAGTEADVWAFIRSAGQTPAAQAKYAALMRSVVNTLDNIIGV